jgi:hypothetical protein
MKMDMKQPLRLDFTWQDAIEDGLFVDVTDVARMHGWLVPVYVSVNAWEAYVAKRDAQDWFGECRKLHLLLGRVWDHVHYLNRSLTSERVFVDGDERRFHFKRDTVRVALEVDAGGNEALTIKLPEEA